MTSIENIEIQLAQFLKVKDGSVKLVDLLRSVHILLNTNDVNFSIERYLALVDKILLIEINGSGGGSGSGDWDIGHELFDTALLGTIMYVSNSDLFWARWIYNKLLWRKNSEALRIASKHSVDFDYVKHIEVLGIKNSTVKGLYTMRLIFVKDTYDTVEELVEDRARVQKSLIILNTTIHEWIDDPVIEPLFYNPIFTKVAGFNLTYHNCNNALLLHQHALFYRRMLEKLYNDKGLNHMVPRPMNKKRRIGFASRFLYSHSVGKVLIGIIEQLFKRDEFEIQVFTCFEKDDPYRNLLKKSCHKFHCFSKEGTFDWINKIKEEAIDILVFIDPLMDINSYILACFRIAPIQIATWGHPDTTGLPTIDYFVSSEFFEKFTDNNYTEKLIKLKSTNYYYYSPNKFLDYNILTMLQNVGKEQARGLFNFPAGAHVYAISCPSIKISPMFEKMIYRLLEADPTGIFVMTQDMNPFYFKNIVRRFNTNMPAHICNRIHTVSFISDPVMFYKYIYAADVILDPFPFGGLISTYDILSCGRAIVTMPGEKLYGRFTSGIYKRMCMSPANTRAVIADTVEDYITKAVTIANVPLIRERIEAEIINNLPVVFEDKATIDDWSEMLRTLKRI